LVISIEYYDARNNEYKKFKRTILSGFPIGMKGGIALYGKKQD